MAILVLGLSLGAAPFCVGASMTQPAAIDFSTVHKNCVEDCAVLDAVKVQVPAISLPSRNDTPTPALTTYTLVAQPATIKADVVAFSSGDYTPPHPHLRFCIWQL